MSETTTTDDAPKPKRWLHRLLASALGAVTLVALTVGWLLWPTSDADGQEDEPDDPPEVVELDTNTVNLENGSGYARFSIAVAVDHDHDVDDVAARTAQLTDLSLNVVSQYTPDRLMTAEGRASLTEDLAAQMNDVTHGAVANVLLTELVVQ